MNQPAQFQPQQSPQMQAQQPSPKKKRRRGLKIFLWLFFITIIAIGSFVAWIWFSESGKRNALSVIPNDAIFVIETSNLTKGWSTLSESAMWKHLMGNPKFDDINQSALSLDSLIKGNETMDMLFTDRQLVISAHMISATDYDFLFAVDLTKGSKIAFIKNYIKEIMGYYDFAMGKKDYLGYEIITLTSTITGEVLYISFIENVLVCSYSEQIIDKSIAQKDKPYWLDDPYVKRATVDLKKDKLFNFYLNFSQIGNYLRCFLSEPGDIVKSLNDNLRIAALNMTLENERLTLSGFLNVNDSLPSYFRALSQIKPGKLGAYDIVSDRAALYVAMNFEQSGEFFSKLKETFATDDTAHFQDYDKSIKKVEKFLKVNLDEDFFSWIGNEISFVKMQPTANAGENDAIAIVHASDMDAAKAGLDHIMKQVKKKSWGAFKFDDKDYKNFTIRYLQYGGFLKLFFGSLFKKFDKPYFTYIDDYVVFSNSPSSLMDFIDDYSAGKTLSHNKEFMAMKDGFEARSSVFAYIQMPKIYSHLYYYSKNEKRKGIKDNKEIILGFTRIGFQMVSQDKMFRTQLSAEFNQDALYDAELESIESAAEELYLTEIDSGRFKPELRESQLLVNGPAKVYYADSTTVKAEGRVADGNLTGLWRSYFESGKIMSAVNYEEGKATGIGLFYFDADKQITRAEVTFEEDLITGTYREFYENGQRKAMIEFSDGMPDGSAEFYYDSGILKISGQYRKGVKSGKWKHYTETGELIDKEKWKKGQKKNSEQ
ncbi:MAG: DUF3352 domain-containing protein [Bacteroidota bacterium]